MIRKLAFALALISLSSAGWVHALGLGEAEVTSSLNQPLRAEIELVSVKGLQEQEILPGLATREEFLKAGVDRVYFLSDLRFSVEKAANGNMIVVLTTNKPVREPFLNFLVEVIWPSGRLLREYSLLIDPPLFTEEPMAAVATPLAQVASPAPQVAPQASGDRIAMPTRTAAPSVRPSAMADSYGPTKSNDTLWDIAAKARPDRSVSPQQVMLAIQDLNPQAFISDNINKLKAGQVLRLPTLEQIRQRSSARAIEEVIAQNQALNPKKAKPVVSGAISRPATQKAKPVAGGDELKLVVAQDGSSTSTANSASDMQPGAGRGDAELTLTLEKLDKSNLENKELSSRVEDLEDQLATLQRLLTLKNDQLAGLQAQARTQEEERLKAEMAGEMPADDVVETDAGMAEEASAEMPAEELAGEQEVADEEIADEEVSDEQQGVSEEEAAPAADAVAVVDEAVTGTSQKQTPESAQGKASTNIFEAILANPLYQGLVAVGLLVLLGILWLISKQNAKREHDAHGYTGPEADSFDESYDGDEDVDSDYEHASDEEGYEEGYEEGEDVFDESSDAPEEKESEKEDVIAEADVYIAYGRLDQAATVLEQGISADPIRTDYRLKLLEVYAETADADAFDRQLSELEAIQDPEAMDRALQIKAGMQAESGADLDDSLEVGSSQYEQETLEQDVPLARESEDDVPDNSFDFESVESAVAEDDEENLGVDLSSEDLELDLDIELDSEGPAEAGKPDLDNEVEGFDAEAADDTSSITLDELALDEDTADSPVPAEEDDLSAPDAIDFEHAAEDEALDLELGDLELSEELEQESEIDLPDDLSIPDELLDLDVADEDSADKATDSETEEDSNAIDMATDAQRDDAPDVAEDVDEVTVPDESLEALKDLESEADVPDVDSAALDDAALDSAAVVSDDILDEAVDAISESDDLEADLGDEEDFDFLNGTDEASTKLDLARAYIDMGDVEGARDILLEVEKEGSSEQQAEAKDLLGGLDK